jgi:DNA-binding NtrC family response regulator
VNGKPPAEGRPRALVVDDDPGVRYTLREILESEGLEVEEAEDGVRALERLEPFQPDLVLADLRMPRMDGMELLRRIGSGPAAPRVVLVTAHGSERQAVEAMKAGAWDYFRKPFEPEELLAVVRRATEAARLRSQNERLAGELALSRTMIFDSPAMSRLAALVARVGPRDVAVLLTGESGTGKERVAEALVNASKRAARPFVRFNCASLVPELAEAELFGHARGAFTGAVRARIGLFGEADGGTMLLDEVGELPQALQAKLLRVLQEGEVRPVGEERSRNVDVRVIAATHRDLADLVSRGQFREDLYWRLNVVHLHVPALREHPEDIPLLARHFLARFSERFGTGPLRAGDEVFARLAAWHWPGNVRELEHAVEKLVALSHEGEVDPTLLPPGGGGGGSGGEKEPGELPAMTLKSRVDAFERGLVMEALRASGGNRTEAARRLGISRVTLHDKLHKHGLARGGDEQ